MKRFLLALCVVLSPSLVSATAHAADMSDDGIVRKASAYDVKTTIDRLESILKKRGIGIVARLNHAANAAKVGQVMRPTELLLFGNPKLGTPVMNASQSAAIDLPMKAVAMQDADGKVWLIYNKPSFMQARHDIKGADKQITMMTGALDKLTGFATTKK